MNSQYKASGNQVLDNQGFVVGTCVEANKAAEMLNEAAYLNDVKRKYTAAARLMAQIETLGFDWTSAE